MKVRTQKWKFYKNQGPHNPEHSITIGACSLACLIGTFYLQLNCKHFSLLAESATAKSNHLMLQLHI